MGLGNGGGATYHDGKDVADNRQNLLPVPDDIPEVLLQLGPAALPFDLFLLAARQVTTHARYGVQPLLFVEEPRRADVAGEHEEADDADKNGEAALHEEYHLPPVQSIALHTHQAVGDQPCEGAGDRVHA